jgi:hypothetical protein
MFFSGLDINRIRQQLEAGARLVMRARTGAVEALCEVDQGFQSSTVNDLVTDILPLTNSTYNVRPTNATRPAVMEQVRNYLAFTFGSQRETCNNEARAQLQQRTIGGNFVNQAALIILGLLRAQNPQQPLLVLRATTLSLMAQQAAAIRTNCLSYLTGTLGFSGAIANLICMQTNGLMNIPPQGRVFAVPRDFTVGPNFVQLARQAVAMEMMTAAPMGGIPLIPPSTAMGRTTAPPTGGISLLPM